MSADPEDARNSSSLEDRVLLALLNLTDEVLAIRKIVDPITRRQRITIYAVSGFIGGAVTNLALWLAGAGTMYGLAHH